MLAFHKTERACMCSESVSSARLWALLRGPDCLASGLNPPQPASCPDLRKPQTEERDSPDPGTPSLRGETAFSPRDPLSALSD